MTDYQLWLGDCLEEMERIESGSVDAIICDLPYNVTNCHWDTLIPFEPLWKQYKRVIKKRGAVVLFGSQPFTTLLIASSPHFGTSKQWFKYEWVWDKRRATGGANSDKSPMKAHENILLFAQEKCTFNPQMREWTPDETKRMRRHDFYIVAKSPMEYANHIAIGRNKKVAKGRHPDSVIRIPALGSIDPERTGHPTQKPTKLLEFLVKTYTNEGDTILDNTCGSGSTGEACLRTGRRFIGIEKDAGYYQVASDRLARVAAELRGELDHLPMFQGVT